jgi:hypothetical protein
MSLDEAERETQPQGMRLTAADGGHEGDAEPNFPRQKVEAQPANEACRRR